MCKETILLLEQLVNDSGQKEDRRTELLRNPEQNAQQGWFMYLPSAFLDALDIKKTPRITDGKIVSTWTQGSSFGFKQGDTIYNTPKAYQEWQSALRHIQIAIQVRAAIDAKPAQTGRPRSPGQVAFDILQPDKNLKALERISSHTVTQDAFVRILITGEGLQQLHDVVQSVD